MKKAKILMVVLFALLMAGGLFLTGCYVYTTTVGGGCSSYYTCTNSYSSDCGRSSCYSYSHYGYTCDC